MPYPPLTLRSVWVRFAFVVAGWACFTSCTCSRASALWARACPPPAFERSGPPMPSSLHGMPLLVFTTPCALCENVYTSCGLSRISRVFLGRHSTHPRSYDAVQHCHSSFLVFLLPPAFMAPSLVILGPFFLMPAAASRHAGYVCHYYFCGTYGFNDGTGVSDKSVFRSI